MNIDKHAELRRELSNPAIGSNHHMRKLALELLDELEAKDIVLSARDYHFDQQADRIESLEKSLNAAKNRIAELEKREPDLYLCRVVRNGEDVYSPCGKDYPRGRGYYAAGISVNGE